MSFFLKSPARPHLLASAALLVWGCAKANDLEPGYRPPEDPSGGTGGNVGQAGSGGSAQSGSAGTPASGGVAGSGGTGGSGPAGGTGGLGGGGGMVAGNAGAGGSSAGGSSAGGGTGGSTTGGAGSSSGAGGGGAAGGTDAAGGAGATAGAGGAGAAGGAGGAGGTTAGGPAGGSGGIPNDPNFMPPDMSDAKIVPLYQVRSTSAEKVEFVLRLRNQTDAPYKLGEVTIRYWMSSEPPPRLHVYYSAAGLAAGTPRFVGNNSNSYVEFNFGSSGVVPVYVDQNSLNQAEIQFAIDSNINSTKFNQSNDWSFDPMATQSRENPKITIYDGDTLIYGCEPSQVCATIEPPGTGEGGAGGESG